MALQPETPQTKAVNRFMTVSGYDLNIYFARVKYFYDNLYNNIYSWYNGTVTIADTFSFKYLTYMINESNHIQDLYGKYKNTFNNIEDWNLLDNLEDIRNKFFTTQNLSKYLRSVRTNNNFSNNPEYDYTLQSRQTLEQLQFDQIDVNNYDDDWQKLAIRNNLTEDSYNSSGGNDIQVPINTGNTIFLNSVIDNLTGKNLYGIDLNQKITFVNNDLQTLGPEDTFLQAINILISIRKNSVPQYKNLGLDTDFVVGTNIAIFQFPQIQRQLNELFATDDTIALFNVKNINIDQDALFLDYEVQSVYGTIYSGNIKV